MRCRSQPPGLHVSTNFNVASALEYHGDKFYGQGAVATGKRRRAEYCDCAAAPARVNRLTINGLSYNPELLVSGYVWTREGRYSGSGTFWEPGAQLVKNLSAEGLEASSAPF